MERHTLKKEMPGAKVGNIVGIDEGNKTYYVSDSGQKIIIAVSLFDLVNSGWAELVKPREGWLGEDIDGGYKFYIENTKPIISEGWDKVTKWVEVLE